MGKIRGDVDVLGLANLLQALALNRRQGVLGLTASADRKAIQFGDGGIRLLATTRKKANSIGQILMRTGRITPAQLAEILEEQKSTGRRVGEIVARRGLISKEDIEIALREQVAEEIYDLFTWKGAQFEFAEQVARPAEVESPLADVVLDMNVASLALEAARRLDELERIRKVIPDGKLVLARTEQAPRLDDSNLDRGVAEALLPFVDGRRGVCEIADVAPYPEFQILRTLYVLMGQGVLRAQTRGGAVPPKARSDATTVILPPARAAARAAAPEPAPPMAEESARPPSPASRRKSVLVLSSMPMFLSAVADLLREEGYEAYCESDPLGVDVCLTRHRPDMAVVDVSIDEEDPVAAVAPMLTSARVPFVVLSANPSREAVMQAIKSGARAYLVKPITDTVLLQRLATM